MPGIFCQPSILRNLICPPATRLKSSTTAVPRSAASRVGATNDHPDFTQELPRKLLPTRAKEAQRRRRKKREFTRRCLWRFGSGVDLKSAHNPKVAGSNPAPATMHDEGLADVETANPFALPRLHPGIGPSAVGYGPFRSDSAVLVTRSRPGGYLRGARVHAPVLTCTNVLSWTSLT
jgi:hypothetical protein